MSGKPKGHFWLCIISHAKSQASLERAKLFGKRGILKKSRASEGFYATIAAVIVIELSLDCHRNLRESYCVCDD